MKNKYGFLGLTGFAGIAGILLDNKQLMAFLLFFLLFLLFPIQEDERFQRILHIALRNTFIGFCFSFATVFLFTAILSKTPMVMENMQFDVVLLLLIQALSWCFVIVIAIFISHLLLGTFIGRMRKRR